MYTIALTLTPDLKPLQWYSHDHILSLRDEITLNHLTDPALNMIYDQQTNEAVEIRVGIAEHNQYELICSSIKSTHMRGLLHPRNLSCA